MLVGLCFEQDFYDPGQKCVGRGKMPRFDVDTTQLNNERDSFSRPRSRVYVPNSVALEKE